MESKPHANSEVDAIVRSGAPGVIPEKKNARDRSRAL